MNSARELVIDFFNWIGTEKRNLGIQSDSGSGVLYHPLIGDDFTLFTTTNGSLNAKEIATNPDFAALAVRLIHESGIPPGSTVGVTLSGSFPSIALSVLAALQTLDMNVILMSSLGASSFGANQPGASWIDMENWLLRKGVLRYRSDVVTLGGENDTALGLMPEGKELLLQALEKNKYPLYTPESLKESIDFKKNYFLSGNTTLLINIGGNQASVGNCIHSAGLPTGLHKKLNTCSHSERGVLQELNAEGIPVIHFLNIKERAMKYGMDISPEGTYTASTGLFVVRKKNKPAIAVFLVLGLTLMALLLTRRNGI